MSEKMMDVLNDLIDWRMEVTSVIEVLEYLMDWGFTDYELRNDLGFMDDDIVRARIDFEGNKEEF